MYRYKIIIEYDGTNFVGWQKQNNGISVQEIIENAMQNFTKNVQVYGSGRTDAGVHAIGQVAHFELPKSYSEEKMKAAMNYFINNRKIYIKHVEHVPQDFHARFSAKERIYMYKILNQQNVDVFLHNRAWHLEQILDYQKMHIVAQSLVGKHDFNSFRSSHCQAKRTIRTINKISVTKQENIISINIAAPSFLHNQVRIIVGSLYEVGMGKWDREKILSILESKDRCYNSITAPAHGLYFLQVKF